MSRPHDLLLKRLCSTRDTLKRARELLNIASHKTRPGSGYDLGQGASVLPAICAYIACQNLGDSDVTLEVAQNAACVTKRAFSAALKTVKNALAEAEKDAAEAERAVPRVSYESLLLEQKMGKPAQRAKVRALMQDAEDRLMRNAEMERKYGNAGEAVTVAVFCWTLTHMGLSKKVDQAKSLKRHGVSPDLFDNLTEALHELCQATVRKIEKGMAELKAGRAASTGKYNAGESTSQAETNASGSPSKATVPARTITGTPSKATALVRAVPTPAATPTVDRRLPVSPSKSALKAPSLGPSPAKTPNHKRKVVFDSAGEGDEEEFDELATPSKKQKYSYASPMRSVRPSPAKPALPDRALPRFPAASSSHATLDLLHSREASSEASTTESLPAHELVPETDGAGPSTPRRPRIGREPVTPTPRRSGRSKNAETYGSSRSPTKSPKKALSRSQSVADGEMTPRRARAAEQVPRKRFLPAFVDQQQWLRRDPRLERELKAAEARWRELKARFGDSLVDVAA